jgi:RNA polymerase sigma-70 factor (family 1)
MQTGKDINYVRAFQNGESSGFEFFFNTLYKPAYLFALRYINDKPAAEDIVSNSFIRLWNKHSIFETAEGIKAYLYKSVHNACIRHLQRQQSWNLHNKKYSTQIDTTQPAYIHNIIKAETINNLHEAISGLPGQCKTVFTKLYVEGKSVAETAQEMDLAISTIKNQKARGIKLLKLKLTP